VRHQLLLVAHIISSRIASKHAALANIEYDGPMCKLFVVHSPILW